MMSVGCAETHSSKPMAPQIKITIVQGVQCIHYLSTTHISGYISCNWEAYNKKMLIR